MTVAERPGAVSLMNVVPPMRLAVDEVPSLRLVNVVSPMRLEVELPLGPLQNVVVPMVEHDT